jgi:hypothetical protein
MNKTRIIKVTQTLMYGKRKWDEMFQQLKEDCI